MTGQTSESACSVCTANSNAPAGSDDGLDCICNAGFFKPDRAGCVGCVAGKYKSGVGDFACVDCGAGKYSSATAQALESACVECPTNSNAPAGSSFQTSCLCNAGSNGPNGGSCTNCAAGKYKSVVGTTYCTDCGVGTYSASVSATTESTCFACPTNSHAPSGSSSMSACTCNMGHSGPNGGPCAQCIVGKYKPTPGSSPCIDCGGGKYSAAVGQVHESVCSVCPANSNSPAGSGAASKCVCIAGTTGPDGGACLECVGGKYKTATGSVNCDDCGAGKYSAGSGKTSKSTCLPCRPDSDSPAGSNAASNCSCNGGFTGTNGGTCTNCVARQVLYSDRADCREYMLRLHGKLGHTCGEQ